MDVAGKEGRSITWGIIDLVKRDGRIPDGKSPVQGEFGCYLRKSPFDPNELPSPKSIQDKQMRRPVNAEGILIIEPAFEGDEQFELGLQGQAGGFIPHQNRTRRETAAEAAGDALKPVLGLTVELGVINEK
jgi:hypothetical protein